jgi:hypothetical protein
MKRCITTLLAACLLLASACAVEPELETTDASLSDGTPDGIGLLAFINDSATTFELLDIDVALDRRAAENLVAARPFDAVDEVDAVSWVGPSAMGKLLAYARDNGWVPTGDDVLGTYDGVVFSVVEAERALALVNDESEAVLDGDVGLDPRAVNSILEARPVASVLELSKLYWVGGAMLTRIRDYDVPVVLGTDCLSTDDCTGPSVYCQGRPHDGSSRLGICRDLSNVPGASEDCSSDDDCLAGLACSGLTMWNTGYCRPHWMFATYTNDDSESLPMSDVVVSSHVVVRGLASVSEDIVVELDIVHVEYGELVITLTDPSGAEDVLWDGPNTGGFMPSRFVVLGIPRDADVNGRWTLKVTNPDEHGFGTLRSWTLELSSRFD